MKPVQQFPFVLLVLSLTAAQSAGATVDLCATNRITREAYLFDEDAYLGLGWDPLPGERGCEDFERFVQDNGYALTNSPHKLELGVVLVLLLLVILVQRRRALARYAQWWA